MNISRERITRAFSDYTEAYNAEDLKIKLKIQHTYRVAELCEKIAKSISLDSDGCDLAWLCGMLHDIGRFEQIKRYNTFVDADSVDHAMLGADLLFKEGLIKDFVERDELSHGEWRQLETSIRNHSLYRLQENLTEEEIVQCNILRDADKIDIFRVIAQSPLEEVYNVSTESLRRDGVSEEVKQCFLEKHAVLRALKKTSVDYLVANICLIFELVYPESVNLTKQQGYWNRLLEFESENPDTREWFDYMHSF